MFGLCDVLGRDNLLGGLDKLDGQWSEGGSSLIGDASIVLEKTFMENPRGEDSGDQVKDSDGSFVSVIWDRWKGSSR